MKRVNKGAHIVLCGVDLSESLAGWSVGARLGDLYVAEIDLIDTPEIEIDQDSRGRAQNGVRVPISDQIRVMGVDISSWIFRYERHSNVGEPDIIRFFVQCDSEVLSINGTTPWEDKL
jgi:hypothetical protein